MQDRGRRRPRSDSGELGLQQDAPPQNWMHLDQNALENPPVNQQDQAELEAFLDEDLDDDDEQAAYDMAGQRRRYEEEGSEDLDQMEEGNGFGGVLGPQPLTKPRRGNGLYGRRQ